MKNYFKKHSIFVFFILGLLLFNSAESTAAGLATSLKGKILLQVEQNGEAWYVNPANEQRYYMGRPDDAFSLMRDLGIGITNDDLNKIPIGLSSFYLGINDDSDLDGLSDLMEETLGLDINNRDTDNDGHEDWIEVKYGYNPLGSGEYESDANFTNMQKGKIFLQVENNGEAWYVNPDDSKRYFLGRPRDAFNLMRELGLGISDSDLEKITINEADQDWETFVNHEYGFELKYPKIEGPVLQENNRFYVGGKSGQYVEIFYKDENDTFEEAIEKEFLNNIDKNKCWVGEETKIEETKANEVDNNFTILSPLQYPKGDGDNFEEIFKYADNCPSNYRATNGMRFFLADKNTPDKFTFFSIGQYFIYFIENSESVVWQDSFKFIDENLSTNDWRTYVNSSHGYEIKYPNHWNFEQHPDNNSNAHLKYEDATITLGSFGYGLNPDWEEKKVYKIVNNIDYNETELWFENELKMKYATFEKSVNEEKFGFNIEIQNPNYENLDSSMINEFDNIISTFSFKGSDKIYLVGLAVNDMSGDISRYLKPFFIDSESENTDDKIKFSLNFLFNTEALEYGSKGLENNAYLPDLIIENVFTVDGVTTIKLKGEIIGTGSVMDAFTKLQITKTIEDYTDNYIIELNNSEKEWRCAIDVNGCVNK